MLDLYRYAERRGVAVYHRNIPVSKGIAIPDAVCLDDDLRGPEERTVMAHDLGHVVTGSFYSLTDPAYIRQRMEHRADKWAIKKLVPRNKLKAAIRAGYSETWELAEYFGVTEELIRKAMWWYENGNLALDMVYNR